MLAPSRLKDPMQKIMFIEGNWVSAHGGHAVAQHIDGIVYLAISVRNVGSGIAVCQAWAAASGVGSSRTRPAHAADEEFRGQSRDLYIPAGDIGMWQGALRNPHDPVRGEIAEAIDQRRPISIELLYTDQVGHQGTITRFGLNPVDDGWIVAMNRHWYLDRVAPRADSELRAAAEVVQRDRRARQAELPRPGPSRDGG